METDIDTDEIAGSVMNCATGGGSKQVHLRKVNCSESIRATF
jgi:hypothetical protein